MRIFRLQIKLSNAFVTYLDTLHGNSEHMVTPFDEELDISLIRQFIVEKCKYTSPLLQQPLDDSIKEEMLRAIIPLVNPFARLMKFCKVNTALLLAFSPRFSENWCDRRRRIVCSTR